MVVIVAVVTVVAVAVVAVVVLRSFCVAEMALKSNELYDHLTD